MFKSKIRKSFSMLLWSLIILLAQNVLLAEDSTKITTTSAGHIKLGLPTATINFVPTSATPEWKFAYGVKGRAEAGQKPFFTLFTPPTIKGNLGFTKRNDGINCTWDFKGLKDFKFNTLAIEFLLPVKAFAKGKWKTDADEGTFPEKYGKTGLFGKDITSFSVTAADRTTFQLQFPKPIRLGVEDNRRWGSKTFKIRFGKVFGELAKGEKYQISANFTVPGKVSFAEEDEVTIRPGKDWVILNKPELDIIPGSALDLSKNGFTQGPCGSKGRVIVTPEGHFAFADDPNTTQRFYGANLCFSSQFMPKDKVDILLDRWLKMGYNTLRIHHYEFGFTNPIWKTGFNWDKKKMEQFCYLIAGCSKRGIWLTTDLFTSRPVSPEQIDVPATKLYMKNKTMVDSKVYKLLVMVHEPAYQDLLKFTEKLLNYVNPYTGKRLAEEPALAWINLVNEHSLGGFGNIKKYPSWKKAWNKWLAKRYPNRENLAKAIGNLQDNEDPTAGTVEFSEKSGGSDKVRGRLCQIFIADTEKTFINRTKKFLREKLKCQALISNHNCPPNSVLDEGTRESMDYVDTHYYVDHPIFERGWGLPSRLQNVNPILSACLREHAVTTIRLWGKPMTISEVNYSAPGGYRGVGALVTGSLAAFQDWDALWRFAYAHSDQVIFKATRMDYFNLSRDPLNLASDRVAVMLFLRRDLKTSSQRLALRITKEELSDPPANGNMSQLGPFQWNAAVGASINYLPKGAIHIPLTFSKADAIAKIKEAGIKLENANGVIKSDTGEITLDKKKGVLCIDTPRTAGGYIVKGDSINSENAGLKVDKVSFGATVFVTSLNLKPIRTSPRLLVTHLTDLQNNGANFSDSARTTLRKWGHLPYLVRDGEADVHISLAKPSDYTVWGLSTGGRRLDKIPTKIAGDTLSFTAKVRSPYGACMLYEITTDKQGADPHAKEYKVSKTVNAEILTFDKPFLATYKGWKGKAVAKDSVATIKAETSQGGAIYNFNNGLDLSYMHNQSPVLYLTIGQNNKAGSVKVMFFDAKNRSATFIFKLNGKETGKSLRLFPNGAVPLSKPNSGKPIDLALIKQIQILGNWSSDPVDLVIDKITVEPAKAADKTKASTGSTTANPEILTFDKPFLAAYKGWKDKAVAKDSVATIQADNSQGGAIYNFNDGLDLQAFKAMKPVLYLNIGKNNQAQIIKVLLVDGQGKNGTFIYSLQGQTGKPLRLLPKNSPNLSKPSNGKINLGTIRQIQVIGDWSSKPIDIKIQKFSAED